ncbi:hypothetical protein BSNK01_22050 [Bacillaceae bacterium]
MFHGIAVKLAAFIMKHGEANVNESKVRYGIEVFLTTVFNLLLVFALASYFAIVPETGFLLVSYMFMRFLSGGLHLSKYYRCVVAGLLFLLGGAWLAELVQASLSLPFVVLLVVATAAAAYFACWKYAPAIYHYRRFTEEKKARLKKYALRYVLAWGVSSCAFAFVLPLHFIFASALGILLQTWMILPQSFALVQKLEKLIEGRALQSGNH